MSIGACPVAGPNPLKGDILHVLFSEVTLAIFYVMGFTRSLQLVFEHTRYLYTALHELISHLLICSLACSLPKNMEIQLLSCVKLVVGALFSLDGDE